jgi:hypothetical protein
MIGKQVQVRRHLPPDAERRVELSGGEEAAGFEGVNG